MSNSSSLSTTANIFAAIGFAAQFSKSLYKFILSIRDAPEEISQVTAEVDAWSATFNGIAAIIQVLPSRDAISAEILGQLRNCIADLENFEKRIKKLEKRLRKTPIQRLLTRAQWPYSESSAAQLLKRVQSYHITFSLALATLKIQMGMTQQTSLNSIQEVLSSFSDFRTQQMVFNEKFLATPSQRPLPGRAHDSEEFPQVRLLNLRPNSQATVEEPNTLLVASITNPDEACNHPKANLSHLTHKQEDPLNVAYQSHIQPLTVRATRIAVGSCHLEICRELLREGADANAADEDGDTPLHVALSRAQNYDVVRMLLENGADPGNCNAGLETALHTFFNDTVHQMLLYHGEIIENEARDSRGMTPLHFVTWSSKSTVDTVRRLVEHGSLTDTMLKDNEGRSVLHFAAQRGNMAVVEYLMGLGPHVDVRCRDRRGRTVLHYAVENRRTEIIAKITRQGADIHARDFQGRTVLHHAAWRGNPEATKCLLELGAVEDLLSRDVKGMTPFDVATEQKAEPVVSLLRDFAASHGISGTHGEHHKTADKNTQPTATSRPYPASLALLGSHKFIVMAMTSKFKVSGIVILLLLLYVHVFM